MKHIYYNILACVLCLMGLAACSPEEFAGANEAGLPSITAYEDLIKIVVDQETNQVTFSIDGITGAQPVWIFEEKDRKSYSTRNGLERIFTVAGDYMVEVKVMNRNGLSDGSVLKTFHINNTLMNFDKYYKMLAGADGNRQWRVQYNEQGHMGCGPSGTEGLEWWSAAPNDKKDWGVYDDRMTWSADNVYTYNPGEGGTMYVNTGCSIFAEFNTNDGADFMATVPVSTGAYSFDVVGEDLYIVLPAQTPFCYMPNDEFWNEPRLKVQSMSNTKMELIADNGGIAWHFILTSEAEAETFKGFKYDSEFNMYKTASKSFSSIWFADANWSDAACADFNANGVKMNEDGFEFTMPISNTSEWQGQVHILTDINLTAGTKYDFSCYVEAGAPIKRMTVKICPDGNDNDVLWYKNDIAIAEGTGVVYVVGAEAPIDMVNTRVIFDFGGNDEGNDIKVSNIVLKDNANDDGTVLPNEGGEEAGGVTWADVNSADNLMNTGALSLASCWWANNDWGQIGDPTVEINGNNATITVNEANGGLQWQGQVHLNTGVAIEEGKAYDFAIVFKTTNDQAGVTVKPHPEGDDAHFFSEARHDVTAFDEVRVTYENVVANFSTGNLVITLDFPGSEAGAVIEVKDIIIQYHNEAAPAGGNWVDVNSDENLMTAGSFGLASCWWANNDWGQIASPEVAINGRNATITVTEANGFSQWQGQVHLNTGVAIEEGKTYDFAIVLNPSQDLGGATVKPHPDGDDGHMFSEARHDLTSYDDNKVTYTNFTADFSTGNLVITLDFPGCDAGTVIEVKDIIIQLHR